MRWKWRKNTAGRQQRLRSGHAAADQVPGCWSLRKTRPEPELPERNYCASRKVPAYIAEWRIRPATSRNWMSRSRELHSPIFGGVQRSVLDPDTDCCNRHCQCPALTSPGELQKFLYPNRPRPLNSHYFRLIEQYIPYHWATFPRLVHTSDERFVAWIHLPRRTNIGHLTAFHQLSVNIQLKAITFTCLLVGSRLGLAFQRLVETRESENWTEALDLLRCYVAQVDSGLPTFRGNTSVPSSRQVCIQSKNTVGAAVSNVGTYKCVPWQTYTDVPWVCIRINSFFVKTTKST